MAYADKVFKSMCLDILENGCKNEGESVRPHWEDGTSAYTIKKFGVVNRYDLRKEFPALTLRKTALKSAMDEILWIYQKKSNKIEDLHSHIWDEWAGNDGTIGKAYGYQIGKKYFHHKTTNPLNVYEIMDLKMNYKSHRIFIENKTTAKVMLDQMDGVLWDLKNDPFSRRIMTDVYAFEDLHEMNLYPCAHHVNYNVTTDKDGNKVLNMVLKQRSQDVLAANNWNVVQYSILLMMVAQVTGMIAGELLHVITDCHIYDRHIDIIKELISREEFDAPKVWLNPDIKNFYDFTTDDLHVEGYITGEQIKNIPIAI